MKFKIMLVLLALVAPTIANAMGLGKIELQSALNQPFKARVELLSATANELDSLKVNLAGQEAFDRAGVQRTFLLTHLRFEVQESEDGSDYIKIRSSELIREPFLNFLLEINWSKGRLFREYTVLLDPPTYTAPASKKKTITHPEKPVVGIDSGDHQAVYDFEHKSESTTINYAGSGDYGPAVTGDTLWSIAKATRPDSSVSIQQMMLAILSANPDAFIENNINGLKRGAILQIPDSSEIDLLDQTNVLAQVNSQHALWDEYKGRVSAYVSQQAESSGAYSQTSEEAAGDIKQESSIADVEETGEAELRLISEPEQGSGSGQSSAELASVNALNNELALTNESIEALFLENTELEDKLTETEGIIYDLKRLIVLKEDELAAMQEQTLVAAAEQESTEVTAAEEEAKEEFVEEEKIVKKDMESETSDSEGETIEEVMIADDEDMAASSSLMEQGIAVLSGLKDQGMSVLEKAKANLKIIGGVVGGLLLLVFLIIFVPKILMIFVSKKRDEKAAAVELSAEDFLDFDDELDSESVTVIPEGGGEEAALLSDDSANKEAVSVSGDASDASDAFEAPEDAAEISKENSMEEVNIFLAYEHFNEAESFVRNALKDEPDNLNFHSKLLEVFYASGNKKSYEDAARVVNEKTGGQGEYWDMATVMWQEMSPNRALFGAPIADEEELSVESTDGSIVNIAASDDGSEDGADMDFNIIGSEESAEEQMNDTLQMALSDASEVLPVEEGAAKEVLNITTAIADEDEDLLDISIVQDSGDSNELDMSLGDASTESSGATNISLNDTPSAHDEDLLDISIVQDSGDSNELDMSLGDASTESSGATNISLNDTPSAHDEDLLDISIVQDSGDSNELDMSLGDASTESSGATNISLNDTPSAHDEDLLDISIVQDSGDSNELDMSLGDASTESSGATNISLNDTPSAHDEDLLDISIVQDSGDSNELDMSLGDASTESSGATNISLNDTPSAHDEDLLDISIVQDSGDSNELDMSLGDASTESSGATNISLNDTPSAHDEDLLDISIVQDSGDSNELDMSLGDASTESSGATNISLNDTPSAHDEDLLDISIVQDSEESAEEQMNDTLQMALSDASEVLPVEEGAAKEVLNITTAIADEDEDLLDISIVQDSEESAEEQMNDTLQMALSDASEVLPVEEGAAKEVLNITTAIADEDEDLLDISIVQDSGDSNELDMSLGDASTESSGATNISLNDTPSAHDEDLLDISIVQDSGDSNELDMSLGDASTESSGATNISLNDTPSAHDEDLLDISIVQDSGDSNELDMSLGDASTESSGATNISLDNTLGEGGEEEVDSKLMELEGVNELDLDLGEGLPSDESVDFSLDLDSNKSELEMDDGMTNMDSNVEMSPENLGGLSTDDDDDDKTHFIAKSPSIAAQSENEEIASQLDLAKAYIELGDTESAKTILDEIIARGSDSYRQKAEELIGQID